MPRDRSSASCSSAAGARSARGRRISASTASTVRVRRTSRLQLRYRGGDIKKAWEGGDVEVIAMFAWADIRMPIVKVDEASHVATLTLDPRPSNKEADARYFIENAPDALDTAGEWYLDRKTHTVTYWPVAGENMPARAGDRAGARATRAARRQTGSRRVRAQRDLPRPGVCARRLEHGSEGLRRHAGGRPGAGGVRGDGRGGVQTRALHRGALGRLRHRFRARQQTQSGAGLRTVRSGRRRHQTRRGAPVARRQRCRTTRT